MRIEWQAIREEGGRKMSVSLAVQIKGESDSAAMRATRYLDKAREVLDPGIWEDDDEPQDQGEPSRLRT